MNENIVWSPGITLDEIEKQVILKAFRFYRGNKTATSNALGIAVRTLDNKLERYETEKKEEEVKNAQERAKREEHLARARGNVQTSPQTGTSVFGPASGVRVESASDTATQQDMPVPKRREVQEVLPRQTAQGGTKGHR